MNWLRRMLRSWLAGNELEQVMAVPKLSAPAADVHTRSKTVVVYSKADNGYIVSVWAEDANGARELVRVAKDGEELFAHVKALMVMRGLY